MKWFKCGKNGPFGPNLDLYGRPIYRPIIHKRVVLEGLKSPKSSHKLVLPENVSIRAFYTVIPDEMDPKVAKLVNLVQIWTWRPIVRPIIQQRFILEGSEPSKSPLW